MRGKLIWLSHEGIKDSDYKYLLYQKGLKTKLPYMHYKMTSSVRLRGMWITTTDSVEKNVSKYFVFSLRPKSTHYNILKFEIVRLSGLTFQEVIRERELYL